MGTRDQIKAAHALTLGAGSNYVPINFHKDYGATGNKLALKASAATLVLVRGERLFSPSLETGIAITERYPEDLVTPTDWAVGRTAVLALPANTTRTITFDALVDVVYISAEAAATVTVTLLETISSNIPAFSAHGSPPRERARFTPIAGLTRNYANNAQVIIDPGFWTDNKTTPTYFRTNEVAQGAICKVSGFTSFAVAFSRRPYGRASFKPSVISYRKARTETELWSTETNWVHGLQAHTIGATMLYPNLDPGGEWFIQWAIALQASDENATAQCDSHAQADAPWSDAASREPFIGNDFIGYETTGNGTFKTIVWDRPTKNFLILSDSNSGGPVVAGGGRPTVDIYEPRSALIGIPIGAVPWDAAGGLAQWEYLTIQQWCRTNGYIPRILNRSFGGSWQSKMGSGRRGTLTAAWPGVYLDVIDTFKYRTNYSNTDYTVSADWTWNGSVGFVPALIMLGSFYNDALQANLGADATLNGSLFKDNVGLVSASLLTTLYNQWSGVALFVYGPEIADNAAALGGVTTLQNLRLAVGAGGLYYNITTPGGAKYDANKGRFIYLADYSAQTTVGTTGASLHMTAAQHALIEQFAARAKFAELSF